MKTSKLTWIIVAVDEKGSKQLDCSKFGCGKVKLGVR